jgi:NAD(P)-dependent dehydrogenase (short-subunit alcohol dehydrogenase family)
MNRKSDSLAGKVALITGGSSGIGRSAALAFARVGAKLVVAARGAERGEGVVHEIEADGGNAIFVRADVSRVAEVKQLISKCVEQFGRLDCAFNNAADPSSTGNLADITEEDFDLHIALNLKSVWACMKYEIQQMLRQEPKGGAIEMRRGVPRGLPRL